MFNITVTQDGKTIRNFDTKALALVALHAKEVSITIGADDVSIDEEEILLSGIVKAEKELMEQIDEQMLEFFRDENDKLRKHSAVCDMEGKTKIKNQSSKIDELIELGKELGFPDEYIETGLRVFLEGDK